MNDMISTTHVKDAFCIAMCHGKPPRSTCTSLGTCKRYDEFIKLLNKRK